MARSKFSITSRRCIAVDLGQSRIKAILVERKGSRVEVLHAFTLDLQEEGLLSQEETNRHISRILLEMGDFPVSMAIPQHVAVSHLIALPGEGRRGGEKYIEEETQKLTGLSESAIVYDYFRLRPFQRQRNPVWVTVSRERELEDHIWRLRASALEIGEVTNAGNALASAYIATQPGEKRVVLVDVGATATTVLVLERMQPIYATAIPFGGEAFTEALAASRKLSFAEAEVVKKTEILLAGDERSPQLIEAVQRWQQDLEKVIFDWLRDQSDPTDTSLKVVLSGGGSLQPGFLEFLSSRSPLNYVAWRDNAGGVDPQTYAVAYGAALAGLKIAPVSSSLLPRPMRVQRVRLKQIVALNTVALLLLLILSVVLGADSSARRRALAEKSEWMRNLAEARAEAEGIEDLLARRTSEYNRIVPVVQQQQRTRDLLKTIGLMQKLRAEHDLWFVTLADGRSYATEATVEPTTGSVVRTGHRSALQQSRGPDSAVEGASTGWNRFVVELAIPGEPREARETVRRVVGAFNSEQIYRNVDTLASSAVRPLANPEVTLPEGTFSLNLELIPSELPVTSAGTTSILGKAYNAE